MSSARPWSPVLKGRRSMLLLASLVTLTLAGCGEESLYARVDPKEATEIVATLQEIGISASRSFNKDGSVDLFVPREDLARSVAALKDAGFPRRTFSTIEDVFPASGMLTTPFEQRARLNYALNEEIANTLSRLAGVIDARVHVVPAEEDLRGIVRRKPSAAAMIRYMPATDPADLEVKARTVLSHAVAGLEFEAVSVVLEAENPPTRNAEPTSAERPAAALVRRDVDWAAIAAAVAFILVGAVALTLPRLKRGNP